MIHGAKHLRAFLAVAKLKSFTLAARDLHVSQPTLSVQIQQLEQHLNVQLFERDRRHVRLSPDGQRLFPEIEKLYEATQRLFQANSNHLPTPVHLRLGVLPSIAAAVLPQVLPPFKKTYPHIHIEIHDAVDLNLIKMLKSHEIEFALGAHLSTEKNIRYTPWKEDTMSVFYPIGHPIEQISAPCLTDIIQYPQVVTTLNTSVRQIVDAALHALSLKMEIAVEAHYLSTAAALVQSGLGLAILPTSASQAVCMTHLRSTPIAAPSLKRQLVVLQRENQIPSLAAQQFIQFLLNFSTS